MKNEDYMIYKKEINSNDNDLINDSLDFDSNSNISYKKETKASKSISGNNYEKISENIDELKNKKNTKKHKNKTFKK